MMRTFTGIAGEQVFIRCKLVIAIVAGTSSTNVYLRGRKDPFRLQDDAGEVRSTIDFELEST